MSFWDFLGRYKERRAPYHPPEKNEESADEENLKKRFEGCADFISRSILAGGVRPVTLCFMNGMVDSKAVSEYVIGPLTREDVLYNMYRGPEELAKVILAGGVYSAEASQCKDADDAELAVLSGSCVLLLGEGTALAFEVKSAEKRSVSEPSVENVVKGGREAFVESLSTNCVLIRRRLRSAKLKAEKLTVGRQSKTDVMLFWYEGLTKEKIVTLARERLKSIDVDALLSTGGIEEYICDDRRTMFPQTMYTERPAEFAACVMEGMAGILVDGLPLGFLLPATFAALLRPPEDRSQNFAAASVMRVLHYLALALTLFLPAFYVALASFHQEMIPTRLMLSIIESKQHVPFSTPEEAIIMLLAFEILLEAGLRLPKNIGQTVSIIGGIIVGQSAVEAKLASPVMVIVIAASGITGFTIPNQDLASAVRVWRFLLVLLASALGMLGAAMGAAGLIYRLCSIETFTVPYLSPFSGGRVPDMLRRALLRPPLWSVKTRPADLGAQNVRARR